jgi:hypothetical protein
LKKVKGDDRRMRETLGYLLLTVTIVSFIALYFYIFKKKVYDKDFFGLIVDSWEVVGLTLVLVLVSLVLIFNI